MSVVLDPVFGCELAQGRSDKEGYCFWGKTRAHIAAWERVHGQITQADEQGNRLELDHMCRRRNCCALHHLELVTRSENEKRKSWKYRAKRTTCPKGHDMNLNAATTPEGGRVCRQCNREAQT
jgi:HNH endonuclease